ncbi:MAG: glycosyltransferase [Oscillospiraceae bacterium]|nr:glycosyltransferase [Oscillospiraceae bacterium]
MEKGVVSVVLPIYNVEKYLDRCITSVVSQTYQNLEIILVDDGSPDRCPEICENWAKRDARINVIHKQNQGLGMARNTGIEHASGEYICFFDSDDYVELDTIEKAYAAANAENADVVCFGMLTVDSGGKIVKRIVPTVEKTVYHGTEVQEEFLPKLVGPDPKTGEGINLTMSACCRLFSMTTIQKCGWRFVSERDIISEDFYSQLSLYRHVNTVCVLQEAFYYYCENSTSLTHTYRPDRYKKICFFYTETVELCRRLGYSEEVSHRFTGPFLSFVITALKQEVRSERPLSQKRKLIRKIVDDELLQQVLRSVKSDRMGTKKKLLYWSMRNKCYALCYTMLVAQSAVKCR